VEPHAGTTATPQEIVGILPAAGYATRLHSAGLVGSKELVEVDGRSTLEHAIARLRLGGATDVRVVTRPEKGDVVIRALAAGATVIEGRPPTAAASVALGVADLTEDQVVLIDFPDMVWEPEDGFRPVLAALVGPASGPDVSFGCFEVDEPERGDVVELDGSGRVVGIEVKPSNPRSNLVWGCAATTVGVLDGLAGFEHVGDLFTAHLPRLHLVGRRLPGRLLDIGTPEALASLETREQAHLPSPEHRERSRPPGGN